ncbi:MAG: GGDEF domain-containing response regulator [Polyangiaceae bacterium]
MRVTPRVLLIDPSDGGRTVLAERLRLQGFLVVECRDGAEGAVHALEEPPAAVVADLTMPSISGVQLCRLLRSETGTSNVPVILRGSEGRRNHFWAEQAGAFAYVMKGRMGELVRALRRAIEQHPPSNDNDFFVVNSTQGLDVRERIATHLDAALFESVIAAEVRRLGTSESFDRLVDLLSQFVSQVTTYRWMAVLRAGSARLGIHVNPRFREQALAEATKAFACESGLPTITIEDDDAAPDQEGPPPVIEKVHFGEETIATFALAPRAPSHPNDPILVKTIANELGGALRMATLVEESRSMATTDTLTGLLNRRAFVDAAAREVLRSQRYRDSFSVILMDVDHFKHINDRRGHSGGDAVLGAVARLLAKSVRSCDVVARWGGEEFVVALPSTGLQGASEVAERLRANLESQEILDPSGDRVPVTASFGVAELSPQERLEQLIDRADRAMYAAKSNGRNQVFLARGTSLIPGPLLREQTDAEQADAEPSDTKASEAKPGAGSEVRAAQAS